MLTIQRSTPNVGADFQLSASSLIGLTEIQSDYSVNWVKVIYNLQFIIYYLLTGHYLLFTVHYLLFIVHQLNLSQTG